MPNLIDLTPDGKMVLNFHAGQAAAWNSTKRIVAVVAGTRGGKAIALDTPIPTPNGFVPVGSLAVGDTVFDSAGQPCCVTRLSPVYTDHDCYRLVLDDGTSIIADADHRWVTSSINQRKNRVRRVLNPRADYISRPQCQAIPDESVHTTAQIRETLRDSLGKINHTIDNPGAMRTEHAELPIAPYTLGAWLGDGHTGSGSITSADSEVLAEIEADGETVRLATYATNSGAAKLYKITAAVNRGGDTAGRQWTFQARLRAAGLLGNKHIPAAYLFASVGQRLAMLQGLMDTDGYCAKDGECQFCNTNENLARGVLHLARSLGIKAELRTKTPRVNGKECRTAYLVGFTTNTKVFRLHRKASRLPKTSSPDVRYRRILFVEPVQPVPVRCIEVDSPSHTYLCGESFVTTHNTSFGPHWLLREMRQRGPGDYLIAAPSYQLLDKAAAPEIKHVFETLLRLGQLLGGGGGGFRFRFNDYGLQWLWNTKPAREPRIIFGHADAPDTLEAMTLKAAWLDEAGQKEFKQGSWEAVQRRLSVDQGRVLISTTPYLIGWLKHIIYDAVALHGGNHPDIDLIRFDSTANPAFPQAEYERARCDLPRWKFDMFYRGLFTRPAGMIYDCFDTEIHVVKRFAIPDEWPRYIGLDFGEINTAALFLAAERIGMEHKPTGRLFCYRSYHPGRRGEPRLTPRQHVEALLGGEPRRGGRALQAIGGAHSEDEWRAEFGKAGMPVYEPPIREVEVGIDRVYSTIRRGELLVFSDLSDLLDELLSYSRELNDAGEPTAKIENKETFHLLDALRYSIGYLKGLRPSGFAAGGAAPEIEAPRTRAVNGFAAG